MRLASDLRFIVPAAMFATMWGCGASPGKRGSTNVRLDRPLVVWLHGMGDADAPDETSDNRVRQRLRDAGFDVWEPKGRRGLCDWSEEAKLSVCWPSDERRLATAREIVHEWEPQLATRCPVVIGFSNGGAFATLLAVHGLVRARGFVTLHGFPAGELHIEPSTPSPLLLIGGRGAPWEGPQLEAITTKLKAANWPHRAMMHDEPHAVSDADLSAAISFAREVTRLGCAEGPTVGAVP